MQGSVRKRNGKWYYSFEMAKTDGKRNRLERVGGRTRKEAETALRKAITEYENSGKIVAPSKMSMADYLDYWLANYVPLNYKQNTITSIKSQINKHIKPVLGNYALKSLTPAVLQEFTNNKLKEGVSYDNLSIINGRIKKALDYAVFPCEYIKSNPMQYIEIPKKDTDKPKLKKNKLMLQLSENNTDKPELENDELVMQKNFQCIIELFPYGNPYHIPLMIGYYTGIRISECVALTWNDIDLESRIININKSIYLLNGHIWCVGSPKSKSSYRKIKIGTTLTNLLKQHKIDQKKNRLFYGEQYTQYYIKDILDNNKHHQAITTEYSKDYIVYEPVCTRINGNRVATVAIQKIYKRIEKKLLIPFCFHSLRHFHTTTLIRKGVNVKAVQVRLGHASANTTLNVYTHSTDSMAEEAANKFEEAAMPTSCQH